MHAIERRRSSRFRRPVVLMNSSWSVSDRQWRDPVGPVNLPRDIRAQGPGAGTPESPVSLNDEGEEEDGISVLSHPPTLHPNIMDGTTAENEDGKEEEVVSSHVPMNVGVEQNEGEGDETVEEIISVHSTASDMEVAVDDSFIGREWGRGVACLCTNAKFVIPLNSMPESIRDEFRPTEVQCLVAKANDLRSDLWCMHNNVWDDENIENGLKPTKRWVVVRQMLARIDSMLIDVRHHMIGMEAKMDSGVEFDYTAHSSDSQDDDARKIIAKEKLNDYMTQMASSLIMAGGSLLYMSAKEPDCALKRKSMEYYKSVSPTYDTNRCTTCGNIVDATEANARIVAEMEL